MLPESYQKTLQKYLTTAQLLLLGMLLNVLQSERQAKLLRLAGVFPSFILAESRRRKLQRFLSLPQLSVRQIWYPLITNWLNSYCHTSQTLSIVIDRSQWGTINLLMVSLVWERRAIPLYWSLLPKQGSSNFSEQKDAIAEVLAILKSYKIVVLGDREFCGVEFANWLRERGLYFCLRLKCSTCIETEPSIWQALKQVGLAPGISRYFQGVRVRKTQPVKGFNVAGKWKRKYRGDSMKEGWFLLTNFQSVSEAVTAYKKRMGIEEMFRDYKSGGYNLEGSGLQGQRLMALILLIALAYTSAIIQGTDLQVKGSKKYVSRPKEANRKYLRRSTFGSGIDSQQWLSNLEKYALEVEQLMTLTPNKRHFYQRGREAVARILSSF